MKTKKANNAVGTDVVVVQKTTAMQKWNSGDYWEDVDDCDDVVVGVYLADEFDDASFRTIIESVAVEVRADLRDSAKYDGTVTCEKRVFSPYSREYDGFADMSVEGEDLKWRFFVTIRTIRSVIGEVNSKPGK